MSQYECVCMRASVCVCVCVPLCVCVCMSVHVHVCVCVFVCAGGLIGGACVVYIGYIAMCLCASGHRDQVNLSML